MKDTEAINKGSTSLPLRVKDSPTLSSTTRTAPPSLTRRFIVLAADSNNRSTSPSLFCSVSSRDVVTALVANFSLLSRFPFIGQERESLQRVCNGAGRYLFERADLPSLLDYGKSGQKSDTKKVFFEEFV